MKDPMSETSIYAMIGGEETVARLVDRFYALMDTLPQAEATRAIHPQDLAESREKLTEYLTMWLGGPQTFIEKRGAPMLRRRHLPFAIGTDEIEGWLVCFRQAAAETIDDERVLAAIMPNVEKLAQHMRNREE